MPQISPRIRLALVITELEVGGAERCLVNLATGLDRAGFDPVVFVLARRPTPPHDALVGRLEQAQIPLHFLDCSSKWQLFTAVRRLRRAFERFAPQVVQSMLYHANVVTWLALRPLVRSHWCAGIRVADPSRVRQAVERRALRVADQVVCVSQTVADYVVEKMGLPSDRLVVIPNGVDTQTVASAEPAQLPALGLPTSQRAIICVARLATQKGIDQLLLAAPHFLRALPQHDLLLVGDGPLASELRRLAQRLGIAERVHFCGWRPNIIEMLWASDLAVLPSRWEGMPNVLLEAMACARPVVCTQVEGVLEVLGPLAARQTIPVDQPQLLADKVVSILGDSQAAVELGAANQRRVVECFSLQAMLDRYVSLYSGVSCLDRRA